MIRSGQHGAGGRHRAVGFREEASRLGGALLGALGLGHGRGGSRADRGRRDGGRGGRGGDRRHARRRRRGDGRGGGDDNHRSGRRGRRGGRGRGRDPRGPAGLQLVEAGRGGVGHEGERGQVEPAQLALDGVEAPVQVPAQRRNGEEGDDPENCDNTARSAVPLGGDLAEPVLAEEGGQRRLGRLDPRLDRLPVRVDVIVNVGEFVREARLDREGEGVERRGGQGDRADRRLNRGFDVGLEGRQVEARQIAGQLGQGRGGDLVDEIVDLDVVEGVDRSADGQLGRHGSSLSFVFRARCMRATRDACPSGAQLGGR